MNATLIAELEKLNDRYPFRVFEVETLDGRRIRITQRFRKLWGSEEKKDGDIRIENGMIAFLRYDELKDVIYFVPAWKQPFRVLYYHPEWLAIATVLLMFGVVLGINLESCSMNGGNRSAQATEQKR
jgi:hypothetical protein